MERSPYGQRGPQNQTHLNLLALDLTTIKLGWLTVDFLRFDLPVSEWRLNECKIGSNARSWEEE